MKKLLIIIFIILLKKGCFAQKEVVYFIAEYNLYFDSWHGNEKVIKLAPYTVKIQIDFQNGVIESIQTFKKKFKYEGNYVVIDTMIEQFLVPNPVLPGKFIVEEQVVFHLVKDGIWHLWLGNRTKIQEKWKLGSRVP